VSDLISQLSEFAVRTKRLLNTYPYEVRMSKGSVIEFSDKFCPFAAPSGTEDSLMGIPIVQSSLVPEHEAWVFYHDETVVGGFRIEKIKWGDA
jgi:hypothetical protein